MPAGRRGVEIEVKCKTVGIGDVGMDDGLRRGGRLRRLGGLFAADRLVEDLSKHKMDSEELIIDEKATEIVNAAKRNKRRVCAVGTTAMRGLESAVSSVHTLNTFNGWTNKFVFPPYEFSIANCMVTNFHLPKSTLLMMVSAFVGHDLMKKAYKEAIMEGYKFYSYGDAMLII